MDLLKMNTPTICRLYTSGDLKEIPQLHIARMMNAFLRQVTEGTPEENIIRLINCINKYMHNIPYMVDRYLRLADSKRITARHLYERLKTPEGQKLNTERIENNVVRYYKSIQNFYLGAILYEGEELEIYRNLTSNYTRHSLTCFYTEAIENNSSYFKTTSDLVPSEELTTQFLLTHDIFKHD